jgi:endo-1,4-beta-D-glucanase Y
LRKYEHARSGQRRIILAVVLAAISIAVAVYVVSGGHQDAEPVTLPAPIPTPIDSLYPGAAVRPSTPQDAQDAAVSAYYDEWKSAFLRQECPGDTYQVYSPDAAYPYVAEAQAYGLVITASMADTDSDAKAIFDGLLRYVLAHPSTNNPDLMAAEQDLECSDVGGANSATDGDMDIGYALLLAHKQWGSAGKLNYRGLAMERINAIKESEVNPETDLMLLGDWSKPTKPELYRTSRTSDWIVHHFRLFRAVTGDSDWDNIRVAHQTAISSMQTEFSPGTGLLPDFVKSVAAGVEPVDGKILESDDDGNYNFNACRVPWRIGLDAITSGDTTSLNAARALNSWAVSLTKGDPDNFDSGYTLKGEPYRDGNANAFWAPLAVAAMTDADSQGWLDALWSKMADSSVDPENYYGTTIQLQVMLVVSGNYTPV